MGKIFSVASWNVEHFGINRGMPDPGRVERAMQFLADQQPDVFAIYEVEGKEVYWEMVHRFAGYSFHVTEGEQMQEILVGVKSPLTAFFTQKTEFKSSVPALRPGSLLTVVANGEHYPILFLHVKSGDTARGFGLRDDMLARSLKFRKVLDRVAGGPNGANYLIVGDLNTMGLYYPYTDDIAADTEIKRMNLKATRYYDMRPLKKNAPFTFSNGSQSSYPASELDHVYAADHLKFKTFTGPQGSGEVDVRGWAREPTTAKQDQWIEEYSDHCLLYFEVWE